MLKFNKIMLQNWLDKVMITNLSYHRERRMMFDLLVACVDKQGQVIPSSLYIALKTYLTAKNDRINDNVSLAFETACQEIADMLELAIEFHKADDNQESSEEEPLKRPVELHLKDETH